MRLVSKASLFAVGVLASGSLSCDHVTGPSLSAEFASQALVPTATEAEAAPFRPTAICCCRVSGSIRNTSSIPVNVSLRYNAFNVEGRAVGTAVAYVENVPVSGTKPFTAAGIFEACDRLGRVETTQFVLGIFRP